MVRFWAAYVLQTPFSATKAIRPIRRSTTVGGMSDHKTIEKYIARAVDQFDTSPLAREFLSRLARESCALFLPAATTYMLAPQTSNAQRFLINLALREHELPAFLADPANATPEIAQELFRKFMEVDPAFDVTMARRLPDRNCTNHTEAFDEPRCTRALDMLDRNSPGRRLLPILSHLPNSLDQRVAAKATLFIGRRLQSPVWVANLLSRPDPRLRASAVESIWGLNTTAAIRLLEKCTDDLSNRVMGNALVGLYIAGQRSVVGELLSLSESPFPARRSMAAWAMGKLAEPGIHG
jgi:hypothetical protein